ncbi:WD repeat domain-containing protein 83-like [Pollicipes pollicipes]|uniref:WD repeat domain-containing protein 83-like n=1 Tax=Pollicipes pollicipes TaxID=41117 RepID=UPI00188534DD|nr:WD repeat domain-containing protein 83-like [Pollicipes pollicipes]XP_037090311.1 WD repeat domain-containing protein 83-like [Pollicipes pollicipes]XP_037090312.1 WD repeat domain-containing protein 83-like [Pollicipes pollicipes]XP_037090313.1 WD repeat domain-containing protein 83-like [Pollicipes pollicipes]
MAAEKGVPTVQLSRQDCRQGAVRAARLSFDGCFSITGGSDKTLKLWNPFRGAHLKTYVGHGHEVLDCQGSCDNGRLLSCGADRTVIVWEVSSGRVLNKWRAHAAAVTCCGFNEDSSLALSGSVDGAVKAWDCRSRRLEPVQTLDDATDSVTALQVTDSELLTGSADGRVRRYDLRNGQLVTDAVGEAVSCLTLSRDGQCLLVGCMDATVKLLDRESGELLNEFSGHKNAQYPLASCLDAADAHVLSGSEDGHVHCWDLVSGKVIAKLVHAGADVVHSLAFHPSRAVLLTAAGGATFLWGTGIEEEQMEA